MKFVDLVPPLELCKKIPAGEFDDCALYWAMFPGRITSVMPKECGDCDQFCVVQTEQHIAPAPTLQEIMAKIAFAQVSIIANKSFVIHPRFGEERYMRYHNNNAAAAALKLWLKLKGIE